MQGSRKETERIGGETDRQGGGWGGGRIVDGHSPNRLIGHSICRKNGGVGMVGIEDMSE